MLIKYKDEVARRARDSDTSLPALALDRGLASEALRHWLRQGVADADEGYRSSPTR